MNNDSKLIRFSIITTTFNRLTSGYLQDCIESVKRQSPGDYVVEHIIVNDGSSDGTFEFLEQVTAGNSSIKCIHQSNMGPAKATQRGIAAATGDYLIILDDDDMLTEDSLVLRTKYINDQGDIDFFYGLADWVDEFGLPTNNQFQSKFYEKFLYERMLISNCINAGTTTVKASLLKKIQWPTWLKRSQDYFLWLEVLKPVNKAKVGFINEYLCRYRYHQKNYTSEINKGDKSEKKALNYKIKQLHSKQLAFLAEEAYAWSEEAHKTNDYYVKQLSELESTLIETKSQLLRYKNFIPIKVLVKSRNVFRGQVVDRLQRSIYRITRYIKLISKGNKADSLLTMRHANKRWPEGVPLVSVVTPFYNRALTMPDTVRSVLQQTFQDFEYIIVNDGSTELESIDYLNKVKHSKIEIITKSNQGVASARNAGINVARGKYILCLDSDDIIEPTYIEKAVAVLEANRDVSIVSFDMQMFGQSGEVFRYGEFNPSSLLQDNPIITAAVFRREAWGVVGGYKEGIGYEDWEFWINLAENGFFGKHIPEILFRYRTAKNSRYVEDFLNHNINTDMIKKLHPHYKSSIRKMKRARKTSDIVCAESATINYSRKEQYNLLANDRPHILITIPWMSFGGVSTLLYNICSEINEKFDFTFMTGLRHSNEWEFKFRGFTPNIYHLPNLFSSEDLYLEFVSNYIKTRNISILHIVHNGFIFEMLPLLKKRHPKLKIVTTLFNDRVDEYVSKSIKYSRYIDQFSTDNKFTAISLTDKLRLDGEVKIISNGIDSEIMFNLKSYDRKKERESLGIDSNDLAVFFIGRLSEEKNPLIFIDAANRLMNKHKYRGIKFYMIGDGVMRGEVERAVASLGQPNIELLGYKEDIPRFLSAADVFVLPSSIEGFPLSILEAMAMEVATVASNVGAVSEVIDNNRDGFIISPGSTDELVDCIENLYNDRDMLNRIKASARKKVENRYSNSLLGDSYKKLYEDV